ncbi:MAG: DUF354 domain-containing protein [Halanaeroarchaeum sp.]
MDVLVTVQHAENVHFFEHAIRALTDRGHRVRVFAREKGENLALLAAADVEYTALAGEPSGLVDLPVVQVRWELGLLRAARRCDPDVVVSDHGIAGPHVATLLGVPALNFVDTDAHVAAQHHLFVPFSDRLYTPASVRSSFGPRQVRYDGHHELAYLHPARFDPDPTDRVSPFATERDMGKFRTLEDDYGLVASFHTSQAHQGIETALALAHDVGAEEAFAERRRALLADTIDVTAVVVDRILAHGPGDHEPSVSATAPEDG